MKKFIEQRIEQSKSCQPPYSFAYSLGYSSAIRSSPNKRMNRRYSPCWRREEGGGGCRAGLRASLTLEKPVSATFHGANLSTFRGLFPALSPVLAVPDLIARRPVPVSCLFVPLILDRLFLVFERSD